MRVALLRRGLPAIFLSGVLFAQAGVSAAQPSGGELAEEISADAVGPAASIALVDVSAFAAAGHAIFEPGTVNEEAFSYSSVDPETNRLIGLTRPAAIAHSAGVFVEASQPEPAASPSPTPGPSVSPSPGPAASSETLPDDPAPPDGESPRSEELEGAEEPAAGEDGFAGAAQRPDSCLALTGRTCEETANDILGAIGCDDAFVCDLIRQLLTDPLGHVGYTCEGSEPCEVKDDPLGPWSVCDPSDTGAECPDPEDVIDLVWSVDNPLSDLDCTAAVEDGPAISSAGGMVRGTGSFHCNEWVAMMEITVCLDRSLGGPWLKMGCRRKETGPNFGTIMRKIAEPCVKQQTAAYRLRVRGHALDGFEETRDVAKSTATLYCPGTSADKAAMEAIEYAETWLP